MPEKHLLDRRDFIRIAGRTACVFLLGGMAFRVFRTKKSGADTAGFPNRHAWRINPDKCTYCGICATACVRRPSAVKAVNDQKKCSFCVICYAHITNYDVDSDKIETEGKMICLQNAVKRKNYSGGIDGYYIYSVDDKNCIGCGKCVKECNQKGAKSMFLLIRPDLCLGCNCCEIAAQCPSSAIESIPLRPEDDFRGDYELKHEDSRQPDKERG